MPAGEKGRPGRKARDGGLEDVRTALLDAAEAILREEGYAAATARRIAARIGLKHQVVFYYFGAQEALLLALFRRSAEAHRARLHAALASDRPLAALWALDSDRGATKLTLEFLALANHSEAMRAAIAANAEAVRRLQVEGVTRHVEARGLAPRLSPQRAIILVHALARLMAQDAAVGIAAGHAEAKALVEAVLAQFQVEV